MQEKIRLQLMDTVQYDSVGDIMGSSHGHFDI